MTSATYMTLSASISPTRSCQEEEGGASEEEGFCVAACDAVGGTSDLTVHTSQGTRSSWKGHLRRFW